ncbi:hypothetical protein HDV62DRAFT_129138 [Trichoderma sp. SZMC 28011]
MRRCRSKSRGRGLKGGCTDSLHILCISQRRVTPVEASFSGVDDCLDSLFPPVRHILGVNSSMHCTSYRAMFTVGCFLIAARILPKADNVKPNVVPLGSRRALGALPKAAIQRRRGAIFLCAQLHVRTYRTWSFRECM